MSLSQASKKQNSSENYYILVTSDPYLATSEAVGSACILAKKRMRRALWDIYYRTRFKDKIQSGDRVCFYIAGSKSLKGHIIGYATVEEVTKKIQNSSEYDEYVLANPVKQLKLKDVKEIEPINFRNKFFNLKMSKGINKEKWGAVLMGGVRRLSREDWKTLGLK
jgi:hypothetical protein